MINKMEFAKRLKARRETVGFRTPRNLALALCGYSENDSLLDTEQQQVSRKAQNIRNWERGASLPKSLEEFSILCETIDCDPEFLMYPDSCKTPRRITQTAMELTGLSEPVVNTFISLHNVDQNRLEEYGHDARYDEAVRKYLFMPTFNSLVSHPQFRVLMAQLTQFYILREAPPNFGGVAVDPSEYAAGRATVGAAELSELSFTRATQTLRQILIEAPEYDEAVDYVRGLLSKIVTKPRQQQENK